MQLRGSKRSAVLIYSSFRIKPNRDLFGWLSANEHSSLKWKAGSDHCPQMCPTLIAANSKKMWLKRKISFFPQSLAQH